MRPVRSRELIFGKGEMPDLSVLLRQHNLVIEVLHRPIPNMQFETLLARAKVIAIVSFCVGAVLSAGLLLSTLSVIDPPSRPDPTVALLIAFVGLSLVATAVAGLREELR